MMGITAWLNMEQPEPTSSQDVFLPDGHGFFVLFAAQ